MRLLFSVALVLVAFATISYSLRVLLYKVFTSEDFQQTFLAQAQLSQLRAPKDLQRTDLKRTDKGNFGDPNYERPVRINRIFLSFHPRTTPVPFLTWISCGNGKEYRYNWRCDGEDDCGNGLDELDCARRTTPAPNLDSSEEMWISCLNGKEYRYDWRCDGEDDCGNGLDELDCDEIDPGDSATETGIISIRDQQLPSLGRTNEDNDLWTSCGNGKRFENTWRCDGEDDCGNGFDETNCNGGDHGESATERIFLSALDQIIHSRGRTNEDNDLWTSCGNGKRFQNTWRCDGEDDCGNGFDETNCNGGDHGESATETGIHSVRDQLLLSLGQTNEDNDLWTSCGNGKRFKNTWRCDGDDDCGNGFDETNCNENDVDDDLWTSCGNGKIFKNVWRCDGDDDCGNGFDETNCSERVQVTDSPSGNDQLLFANVNALGQEGTDANHSQGDAILRRKADILRTLLVALQRSRGDSQQDVSPRRPLLQKLVLTAVLRLEVSAVPQE